MKRTIITCIAIAYIVLGKALAQNLTTELLLLQQRYSNLPSYSVSMTYTAYKGHQSMQVADMQSGKFEIQDKQMRYIMGDIEIVQTGKYSIQVDKKFKEIDVCKTAESWSPPVFGNFAKMDSVLKKNNALFYRQEASGIRLLIFDLKKSGEEFEKIELRYLPSGNIVSITLFYRGSSNAYGIEESYKPRVVISYKEQNFNASFPQDHFSERKYFSMRDGQFIPSNSFKNFKIFGQL